MIAKCAINASIVIRGWCDVAIPFYIPRNRIQTMLNVVIDVIVALAFRDGNPFEISVGI